MQRRYVHSLIWVAGVTALSDGCVGPITTQERFYYAFELGVDHSLGRATNINYKFGDLGSLSLKRAKYLGWTGQTLQRVEMVVPDFFEVSWETPDGTRHEAKVPVRSRLSRSMLSGHGKGILFMLHQDEVRGYVTNNTDPVTKEPRRFY